MAATTTAGNILPVPAEAAADPAAAAVIVNDLVKASLQETWRKDHEAEWFLDPLCGLLEMLLLALGDPVRFCSTKTGKIEVGGVPTVVSSTTVAEAEGAFEDASAACLKLARNLCAERPRVQAFFWGRGLPGRVARQAHCDWARPEERRPVWREAVTSFLANSVAGNDDLREEARELLYPHRLAAACCLCWHRPDFSMLLLQNVFPRGDRGSRRLLQEPDGHCLLLLLLSLLNSLDEVASTAVAAKSREWATVFFNGLWATGGFVPAYRGIRALSADRLHEFVVKATCGAEQQEQLGPALPPAVDFQRLGKRICGPQLALRLLWHTLYGLLGGPEQPDCAPAQRTEEDKAHFIHHFVNDSGFVSLISQELEEGIAALVQKHDLTWRPQPVPVEAADLLGLHVEEFEYTVDPRTDLDAGSAARSLAIYDEMIRALAELAVLPRGPEVSGRFTAMALLRCCSLLDALHQKRFGDISSGEAKQKPSAEASAASQEIGMVDLLRVCGNLLYEDKAAQDFVRLTDCLRVLLCHCYSDQDIPLLREVGVFAVRNATHENPNNQHAVRLMLEERRSGATANAEPPLAFGLDV